MVYINLLRSETVIYTYCRRNRLFILNYTVKKSVHLHKDIQEHLYSCVCFFIGTCWCDWIEGWQRNAGSSGEFKAFWANNNFTECQFLCHNFILCFVTCNKHSSIIIMSKIKVHLIRRVFFPQGSPGFPGLPGGVGPHGPLVSYILTLKLPKIKIHTICC